MRVYNKINRQVDFLRENNPGPVYLKAWAEITHEMT
jgi:hypothetical protein